VSAPGHAPEVQQYAVCAGDLEHAQHGRAADGEQHLGAVVLHALVRVHQRMQPRRIAEPGAAYVDHEGPAPRRRRRERRHPQFAVVGDVDLFRRQHDWHTAGVRADRLRGL
jgi:hypothetical protein